MLFGEFGRPVIVLSMNISPTPLLVISWVQIAIRELSCMHGGHGFMQNTVAELVILKRLKVAPRPSPHRAVLSVVWRPSPVGWTKINTDGSSQSAPGNMFTGGVFRRSDGSVGFCFHTNEGVGFVFLAELMAVIVALE
ncbi:hypothetical protein C2S52_009099 [Perilla frutescens var. hirtella]|nr:hypothetical protein C2S52_009099 [Perilla frutescens var. hirtella]